MIRNGNGGGLLTRHFLACFPVIEGFDRSEFLHIGNVAVARTFDFPQGTIFIASLLVVIHRHGSVCFLVDQQNDRNLGCKSDFGIQAVLGIILKCGASLVVLPATFPIT